MKDLGARVKRKREQYDLTQEALAGRVGCSRIMIVYIESGEKIPSLALTRKLAKALNYSLDELVNGEVRV
ncbi:MAG: helix-turn-helix domain-containing protein [Oscillospiraceae bacterium]|nr:helix-turn-helix domain-containing protein [Oscillospiraceae bacterium]